MANVKVPSRDRMKLVICRFSLCISDTFAYRSLEGVISSLEESVNGIRAKATQFMDKNYGGGEFDIHFEANYTGYDGGYEIDIVATRMETDEEYQQWVEKTTLQQEKCRLAREKRKESMRKKLMQTEAEERAEYERLKQKFGG